MKRRGGVLLAIADTENLRLAFYKAKKGKSATRQVLLFCKPSLDMQLLQLQNQILTQKVNVGNYHYFTIFEPKKRLICEAPFSQRVLHHAIMNICHEDFDKFQIYDSYASRIGKGTYAALERAYGFQKKYQYCLKLDVRKYFDSIDHGILKLQLGRMYKDYGVLKIFELIIDSYHSIPEKGLPIGNLTSQYFANHYLAILDHFVKERLRVHAYVRYMDDIMIWDNDFNNIKRVALDIKIFLKEKLELSLKELRISKTNFYSSFLGYQFSKHNIRLSLKSKKRYLRGIRELYYQYDNGVITQEEMNLRLGCRLAFVDKVSSHSFKNFVMNHCI